MEFKNYCIVALGDIVGIDDIIRRISEVKIRKLEQKNVTIITFSSVMTPNEILELIGDKKKTFFIFEIGNDVNSYQIGREDIHDFIFGYFDRNSKIVNDYMTNKILTDVNEDLNNVSGKTNNIIQEELNVSDDDSHLLNVDNLTKEEIIGKIDYLLDKGIDNLNPNEKKLLEFLTKKI